MSNVGGDYDDYGNEPSTSGNVAVQQNQEV